MDDYYAFESTKDGSGGGGGSGGGRGGRGIGSGWVVIVAVVIMLLFFAEKGASWDAIDCLLGWGVIAFIAVRAFFG